MILAAVPQAIKHVGSPHPYCASSEPVLGQQLILPTVGISSPLLPPPSLDGGARGGARRGGNSGA